MVSQGCPGPAAASAPLPTPPSTLQSLVPGPVRPHSCDPGHGSAALGLGLLRGQEVPCFGSQAEYGTTSKSEFLRNHMFLIIFIISS